MEKTELVEMERLESIKMIPHRISGKQIEARITAATLILGTIVLNILWWAGIHFISTDSTDNITINNTSAPSKHYAIAPTK